MKIFINRDSKTQEIKLSGHCFNIKKVSGLNMFSDEDNPHNSLFIVIDPLKKEITAIKMNYKS